MDEKEARKARSEALARRLISHPKWVWLPGLVFRWNDYAMIITMATTKNTLFAHFVGRGSGIEIGLDEHDVYPDLLHPITAAVLFERWARMVSHASVYVDRFRLVGPRPEKHVRVQNAEGAWALMVDSGSHVVVHSDDDLGIVAAQATLSLWKRQEGMTPQRLPAMSRK